MTVRTLTIAIAREAKKETPRSRGNIKERSARIEKRRRKEGKKRKEKEERCREQRTGYVINLYYGNRAPSATVTSVEIRPAARGCTRDGARASSRARTSSGAARRIYRRKNGAGAPRDKVRSINRDNMAALGADKPGAESAKALSRDYRGRDVTISLSAARIKRAIVAAK